MNFYNNKGYLYYLVITFVLFSCSKKVTFYCESGFNKEITTISFQELKRKNSSFTVIKDSALILNPVIGLAFYSKIYKVNCRQIRLNIKTTNSVTKEKNDTTFTVLLTNAPNKFVLDLYHNFNYVGEKPFFTLEKLRKGVFFR
jgi:hypothetical protein